VHCTKISSQFKFGVKGQRSRSAGTKNEKVQHFFGSGPWERESCVVRQFYAGGKISACCLVHFSMQGCPFGGHVDTAAIAEVKFPPPKKKQKGSLNRQFQAKLTKY